ncbi:MAG: NHL repeat-containing protein [Cohnella sp.]|nr:NHL repeat-containing protein [Cohnella sp.]
MRTRRWLRAFTASAALTLASLLIATTIQAAVPYAGYTYDGYGDRVWSPVAYVPSGTVTGESLGIGLFSAPEDMYVADDGSIYIADTGNSRIVVLSNKYELIKVIDKFSNNGTEDKFNKPMGVFVSSEDEVYVADTGNHRIVRLDGQGNATLIVSKPESEFFAEGFIFDPKKVVVDAADRIYVIADHVFDGIMQFDGKGAFENYYAANRVQYSVADYVWKRYLSTKEQQERMVTFVPTEYLNMDLDSQDFVFTTSVDNSAAPKRVQRHNPTGTDVLLRQGFAAPFGDLVVGGGGQSRLVDIDVGPDGTYSALDNNRGRIFTYDFEGKLLYIFGGFGYRVGLFEMPTAIERVNDQFIVLDKIQQRITIFDVTRFGQLMNDASHYHYIGNEEKAAELWNEVLKLDANLEIAYSGVSKAMVRDGDNEDAVTYAKYGMDRKTYSKAYQRYRKDVLKEHFSTVMTTFLVAALALTAFVQVRKHRRNKKGGGSYVESAD